MEELGVRDFLYIIVLVVGVAGSHFMLRARVMVLEERVKGWTNAISRVEKALERIEEKLDTKADR